MEYDVAECVRKLLSSPAMSITAKVHHGSVTLPPDVEVPDGTEVEIIIPIGASHNGGHTGPVRLPVFDGGGLQPGIQLDESRGIRRLLDESGKLSQLP